jgi:hypothetical protein
MTADDPYTGVDNEKIVNYQADQVEQRILHMQSADPLRTPTYTMFPKPDYYFSTSGSPNVQITPHYAWNHGYYSPNIDITWVGMAGPGLANNGVDGPGPAHGNEAHDPNSTHTVPEASTHGTWVNEVDIRPTLLHLVGLRDDYQSDGRVITAALSSPSSALRTVNQLGELYSRLDSSEGDFATDTLTADTNALAGGSSSNDRTYTRVLQQLTRLDNRRDALVGTIKRQLQAAAVSHRTPSNATIHDEVTQVEALMWQAHDLATHTP